MLCPETLVVSVRKFVCFHVLFPRSPSQVEVLITPMKDRRDFHQDRAQRKFDSHEFGHRERVPTVVRGTSYDDRRTIVVLVRGSKQDNAKQRGK